MSTYTIIPQTDVPPSKTGYILPIQNSNVRILQGYNGPVSHVLLERRTGNSVYSQDDRFSLDFAVPFKTEIVAAKAGIVRYVCDITDQYYKGLEIEQGFRILVNALSLTHKDGTATLYSHLAKGSAQVGVGQYVEQGQLLAVTGMSGWIGPEPHLHFAALRYGDYGCRRTFPVEFDNYHGPLEHRVLEGI